MPSPNTVLLWRLTTVLNTETAVRMSVFVVRAFVYLRRAVLDSEKLNRHLDSIDKRLADHDSEIATLVQAVRTMIKPDSVSKERRIGFQIDDS